jgi:hypothetical protein
MFLFFNTFLKKTLKSKWFGCFFVLSSFFNETIAQSNNFILTDTFITSIPSTYNLNSQILSISNKTNIYFINKNQNDFLSKGLLQITSINIINHLRETFELNFQPNDNFDINNIVYLSIVNDYILLNSIDKKLFIFKLNGEWVKEIELPRNYLYAIPSPKYNKLVLIEYYNHTLSDCKPLLYLTTINLNNLIIERDTNYLFEGIQYSLLSPNLHTYTDSLIYVIEPLSYKLYCFDYQLNLKSISILKKQSDTAMVLNKKLILETKRDIDFYDSLNIENINIDTINKIITNRSNNKNTIFELRKMDTIVQRVDKIFINENILSITTTAPGSKLSNRKILQYKIVSDTFNLKKEIMYPANFNEEEKKIDKNKYCISCTNAIIPINIKSKKYTYRILLNDFLPNYYSSEEEYNEKFDTWLLTNKPKLLIALYEISN